MNHVEDVILADGRTLNTRTLTYPIAPEDQCMLVDLYGPNGAAATMTG